MNDKQTVVIIFLGVALAVVLILLLIGVVREARIAGSIRKYNNYRSPIPDYIAAYEREQELLSKLPQAEESEETEEV